MNNKRFSLTLLNVFIFCGLFAQTPHSWVLFGDHAKRVTYKIEEEYHIHLDQNGDFYPQDFISDEQLKTNGKNQLAVWAKAYPSEFQAIATSYNLQNTTYSAENFEILQDSIVARIAKAINFNAAGKPQTWLVHGFRKNLYQPDSFFQSTSLEDNKAAKSRINSFLQSEGKPPTYFVEVYWDGRYRHYTGKRSAVTLAKLFKRAIPNAENAGYALRRVVAQLTAEEFTIITHSTGTHVAASLMFNSGNSNQGVLQTPQQHINLILVASASSGKKLFSNYYNRQPTVNSNAEDPYTVYNVYNKKDNVLRANLLYPTRASTKLGCDYRNESGKLATYFTKHFPQSVYREIEVTYNNGAPHRFINYLNDTRFVDVMQEVY